ncbi:MAG: hypothetical protein PUB84_02815 [Bacteroidales bacterium]|nr:hypothetical protein [Bacteroidales bacterium]MDD6501883.1 hypothetical protein [Bacteroidales bacterium]MDD6538442.1 hypothetical protein [Bacteroidales bacterium]
MIIAKLRCKIRTSLWFEQTSRVFSFDFLGIRADFSGSRWHILVRITYLIPHRFFLPFLSLFFLSPPFLQAGVDKKSGKRECHVDFFVTLRKNYLFVRKKLPKEE